MTEVTVAAPGPGSWQLDGVHFPRAVTRLFAETFPKHFDAGFREAARVNGALLETLEFGIVNGCMYFAPRPVGAPKGAKGPPPKFLFKLLLMLHPELRRRVAAARETLATKRWRSELRLWDEECKPAAIKAHLELQSIDVTKLSAEALAAHVERCLAHWAAMITQHHRFDVAALIPVGDFIAQASAWTGLEPAKLCPLLSGASDVSSGASPELTRLSKALRADATASARLESATSAAAALTDLYNAPGELGAAARTWLDLVSYRLQNGLDVAELTNGETPELLVTSIRRALSDGDRKASSPDAGATAAVRDRVPAAHRAQFDELLAEARLVYRIRDERGLYSDIWAAGILRHTLLEAGRRLVGTKRLSRADLILEAGRDEILALVSGSGGPSSADLEARASQRAKQSPSDAPATLGPAPSGPPPMSWLPAASARLESAAVVGINGIWDESSKKNEPKIVRGLGVSAGTAEGIARVVNDVNGFAKLKQGDILVTRSTTAAFNVVLPLLSGIITDRGGALSHAAIVAREYGIPAVVGSREATKLIPEGARVRVDGTLGEAVVL